MKKFLKLALVSIFGLTAFVSVSYADHHEGVEPSTKEASASHEGKKHHNKKHHAKKAHHEKKHEEMKMEKSKKVEDSAAPTHN